MEQTPSRAEVLDKRLEETWGRVQPSARLPDDVSSSITPQENVLWELDPKPLLANHPPRVTDPNTRIFLSEGALTGPCPRDDSGLGWVQIQSKLLLWEEKIEGFSIITSEGLTTLAHPQLEWTITSGMWNTLRTTWGPTMVTLDRVHRINPHEAKENIHLRPTSISRTLFRFFSFSGTSVGLSKSRDTGAAQKKELA
jgi:hypothetical protein